MLNLDQHFGEKVTIESDTQKEVLNYLLNGAAGRAKYLLSSLMLKGLTNYQVQRITDLPYFIENHNKLSGKLHNCRSCHTQALQGSFDKEEITSQPAPAP
jgi:hypothetical protein